MKENFGNIDNFEEHNEVVSKTDLESDKEHDEKKAKENKAIFIARLEEEGLPEETLGIIDFAYDLSITAHSKQYRDSGEQYFEHLWAVGLILIHECKILDPEMIIAALHHDAIEDTAIFGDRSTPFSHWKKKAEFRLGKVFNTETAKMVITLTKPKADGGEIKDDKEAHDIYINNLKNTDDLRIILIKMADRLHNLRTLQDTSPEKQCRIVKETEKVYFPLFARAENDYPEIVNYMLDEMKLAISTLDIERE